MKVSYDRSSVKAGIVHIGVGNFHRAHEAYYTNKLLAEHSEKNWGICGVMLLPSDERLYNALKAQELQYSLTVCGRTGQNEMFTIGSIVELIWGVKEPKAVVDKIASKDIHIISLTITEGGYNIDKSSGEFLLNNADVAHDIQNKQNPKTVFGFVAEGLRQRKASHGGAITILSCDNLQHNGDTCRKAFMSFIKAQDADLAQWMEKNVTFPNSMVDRITPATKPEDITRLNQQNGVSDQAPVYCEDFIQWVIEDKFAAGRPAWEKVGAEFTDDVDDFEQMKLSLLNASHTLLSYPSFLGGYRKVDDAMHDERIIKLVRTFMDKDITPLLKTPKGTNLEVYKQTLVERFANRTVSDQVARLCMDGLSKFPVYVVPNLTKMIKGGKDLIRVAYLVAAYRHYLKYRKDDKGDSFDIAEPWMNPADEKLIGSDDAMEFLGLSAFQAVDLKGADAFVKIYREMVDEIKSTGAMPTLENVLKH